MIELDGENLSLEQVWQVAHWNSDKQGGLKIKISNSAITKMKASRAYIDGRLANGEIIYGVNTGFGAFSSVRISDAEIELLQKNLIRSHSAGIGKPFSVEQTRAMMLLRANTLVRGHSGIRPEVIEKIIEFLVADIIPVVPSQGSVGASGDLAPLSHLALALIGEGDVWASDGKIIPVQSVLEKKKINPLKLRAKEGLSLINGCQVMTAIGLLTSYETKRLLKYADLAGALSLEAMRGSRKAFDPLIAASRPHPGEAKTARNLIKILSQETEISRSHANCNKVQDAYSLRCMPAVHGAVKDTAERTLKTLLIEACSSTDNPLVFCEDNKILSCGNFHGEPVAFAMDFLGIALASLGSISECRVAKLINPAMSELPAFLSPNGGLNSGHMIVQVAAASLVSENKILAHPASVDSIPTSAEKEDHVSMGTIASRKAAQIFQNTEHILAMEFLSASQGLEFSRPLKSSSCLEKLHACIREVVPFAKEDRIFSKDVQNILSLMKSETILQTVTKEIGELEC